MMLPKQKVCWVRGVLNTPHRPLPAQKHTTRNGVRERETGKQREWERWGKKRKREGGRQCKRAIAREGRSEEMREGERGR